MPTTKRVTHGRDLSAPKKTIIVHGVPYDLKFNNRAYRIAEDVYSDEYARDAGFMQIVEEAQKGKMRALVALFFAVAKAGGSDIGFEEFEELFDPNTLTANVHTVLAGVSESMPEPEETNRKNG